MLRSIIRCCLILSLLLPTAHVALAQDDYTPPTDQPGPAVDKLYFKAFDVDRAPIELEAGEMDLYYYSF